MKKENRSGEQLLNESNALHKQVAELREIKNRQERGEDELKGSEERFKILFEYTPDAHYLNDLQGNFIDCNRAAEKISGYKREELIGKNFLELNLLSESELIKAATLLGRNKRGEPTGPDEVIFRRKDGTHVSLEIRTFPVNIGGESLVLGIAHDITDRKRVEEALEKKEREAALLAEASGIFNSSLDIRVVFDEIAKLLSREIGETGSIFKVEGEQILPITSFREGIKDEQMIELMNDNPIPLHGSVTGSCVLNKEHILIEDTALDQRFLAHYRQLTNVTSYICVPLTVKGEVLGVLTTAIYGGDRRFDANDLSLILAIAERASLALENSNLYEKERSQTRRLSVVSKISKAVNSSLDLESVYNSIVEQLKQVIPFDFLMNVALHNSENNTFVYSLTYDHNDILQETFEVGRAYPADSLVLYKAFETKKPHYVPDTKKVPTEMEVMRRAAEKGILSCLFLPLIVEQECIGTLILGALQKDAFTKDIIELLETTSSHLATAIKNSKIYEEISKANREMAFMNEIMKLLNNPVNIIQVVQEAKQKMMDFMGFEDGTIYLLNETGDELHVFSHTLETEEYMSAIKVLKVKDTLNGYVVQTGKSEYGNALSRHPRLKIADMRNQGYKAFAIVPIRSQDKILGTMGVTSKTEETISEDDVKLMEAMGLQLGVALENSNLYQRTITQAQRLAIVNNISRAVNASLDIDTVYNTIVEQLKQVFPFTFSSNIALYNSEEDRFYFSNLFDPTGKIGDILKHYQGSPGDSLVLSTALKEKRINHVANATKAASDKKMLNQFIEKGIRSFLNIPLIVEQEYIGTLNLSSPEANSFAREEIELLETISSHLANAIKNSNIYEEIQKEVDERRRTEEALRESEEQYRTLVENVNVGIVRVSGDSQGRYIQANPAWAKILGYDSVEELMKLQITDVYQNPEDRKLFLEEVLEKGFVKDKEVYLRKKDGTPICASTTAEVTYDDSGNIRWIDSVMDDITERKRAEEALRESEERFRSITENSYDLICEISADGEILYLSPSLQDVLGYVPNEGMGIGIKIFDLIHQDDRQTAIEAFQTARKSFSIGQVVVRYKHKNGEWRWLECAGKPFRTASGEGRGVIVSRDITEKRKMEEELLKMQKLESTGILAGGIAHDFNNILTSILTNLSITKLNPDDKDQIIKSLNAAEKATIKARDLTEQLLTFSRGGAPIKKTASICELIKDTADFVLTGSNVRVQYDLPEDISTVEMDKGQISQVINNMVINAVQAMPDGGVIKVSAANETLMESSALPLKGGKYVKISMEDHGVGISGENLSKIFDPYFTTKPQGSGLGLATSYSIIKKHDGHIDVESQVGVGTTFHFYLPASQKEVPTEESRTGITFKKKGKILIMDDEIDILESLNRALTYFGYRTELARDGIQAVEKYTKAMEANDPFDGVIMDLTIPGGKGGKETIKELQEIDPNVKAIVSSGYSHDPVMANFREYGFNGCITKPYTVDTLLETLDEVLSMSTDNPG